MIYRKGKPASLSILSVLADLSWLLGVNPQPWSPFRKLDFYKLEKIRY